MTESYIQVAPDSTGKKMRTQNRTIDSNDVHEEVIIERGFLLDQKIDDVNGDGTVVYMGWAEPGSATSASVWQIRREKVSGTVRSVRFADSSTLFVKVWDDRTTYNFVEA
jgi:hypothetical protein